MQPLSPVSSRVCRQLRRRVAPRRAREAGEACCGQGQRNKCRDCSCDRCHVRVADIFCRAGSRPPRQQRGLEGEHFEQPRAVGSEEWHRDLCARRRQTKASHMKTRVLVVRVANDHPDGQGAPKAALESGDAADAVRRRCLQPGGKPILYIELVHGEAHPEESVAGTVAEPRVGLPTTLLEELCIPALDQLGIAMPPRSGCNWCNLKCGGCDACATCGIFLLSFRHHHN
mmetsp:Transcript_110738/g.352764  ORF Transcript_110738/g.352764 Transcript_110738/m.352764 type:complete len:229 (-) Transcript_110738:492-1178(-)